jgi:hypothetical protein
MIVFETARLCVHHLLPNHAEALFAICRDPVTMQWVRFVMVSRRLAREGALLAGLL